MSDNKIICRYCGMANNPGDKFCRSCGKPALQEPNIVQNTARSQRCPLCGGDIDDRTKFCRHCGARIYIKSAQPQLQPQLQYAPVTNSPAGKIKPAKKRHLGRRVTAGVLAASILIVGIVHVNKKINGDLPMYSDGSLLSSEYIPDIKSISRMKPQTAEISNASHEADINGLQFDFDNCCPLPQPDPDF